MGAKKIMDKVINGLGKSGYKIDPRITSREIIVISSERFVCLLRGLFLRLWIKQCKGLLFVGKRCKIKHCHKLYFGKTVIIEDNVEINALSVHGIKIGNNVTIKKNTIIDCTGVIRQIGEGLVIGNNVGISQNCFIQVRGKVTIGSNVMFGPNVSVFSENHGFLNTEIPMISQDSVRIGVTIEDDTWIGTGATILDGVTIGKGSIVAAGAVVNQSIDPYSVVAGVPAKTIKSRKLVEKDI